MASECTIKVHCSTEEKNALEVRAKARDMSLSNYLKRRGLSGGESVGGVRAKVEVALALDHAESVLAEVLEAVLRQDMALSQHGSRLLVAELACICKVLEEAVSGSVGKSA